MEKYLKMLKPEMMKYLKKTYGEEEADIRWKRVEELDEKWLKEEGDLGGSANMMYSNMMLCYAMCAFYEACDREYPYSEFESLVKNVMKVPFKMLNLFDLNDLEKHPKLKQIAYKVVEDYKKKSDRYRGNKWGNTWKVRVNPDHRVTGFAYVCDSCPLQEFAKKHGYLDFTRNMCAMDHIVAEQFHGTLIRRSVLMEGDSCCEFWYAGDQTSAAKKFKKDSK